MRIGLAMLLVAGAAVAAVVGYSVGSAGLQTARAAATDCAPLTGSVNGRDPRGVDPRSPNPLEGLPFFVDPEEPSVADYNRYRAQGRNRDADLVYRLASRPKFKWTGRFTKPGAVRKLLGRAQCQQPGTVPELVTLRHQGKQCNPRYQAGGP